MPTSVRVCPGLERPSPAALPAPLVGPSARDAAPDVHEIQPLIFTAIQAELPGAPVLELAQDLPDSVQRLSQPRSMATWPCFALVSALLPLPPHPEPHPWPLRKQGLS